MHTEESSLLGDQPLQRAQHALPSEDVYDRFGRKQKRVILILVSLAGLVPMFVNGCFIPSIPQVSRDLDATPAAVSLGVSLPMFASSVGVMVWSTYSSYYGRRLIYLCGLPITTIASFAVATSNNLTSLLFWRFVQMFGCSGGFAIGAAAIGDIYKTEERGTAMGTFLGGMFFGLAIAPSIGGISAQYWTWRAFQAVFGVWSMIQLLLMAYFLPETAHPGSRGIDKVWGPRRRFVWINPFRCLAFLRSPNIVAITLASSFMFMANYTLVIPIAYTVGAKYGISSEGLIGILVLPNGVGNFVGAMLGGRISDLMVRRAKEERNGRWVPEDRLRAVWLGGLVLTPISVTLAGFTTTYVDGTIGLVINLVCLFTNGAGVEMVLAPTTAYAVDVMPSRSADITAAVSGPRWLVIACASTLCMPAVQTIGVAATNSISGVLTLFGQALIWFTIRYGAEMRAYVDVGYPDFDGQAQAEVAPVGGDGVARPEMSRRTCRVDGD